MLCMKKDMKHQSTANELDLLVQEAMRSFDPGEIKDHFSLIGEGQIKEIYNDMDYPCAYYQWLACLMRVLKPKQVVELGAAAGISTIMMATQLPEESKLYSVDIDPSIAWKWMNREYPQVVKILGNDLDISIWENAVTPPAKLNPEVVLKDTDVWFIDALHTREHLQKELDLYIPFMKKGSVVVLDDIRMEGLWDIWQKLPYDKCENTYPNHYTGFGFFII